MTRPMPGWVHTAACACWSCLVERAAATTCGLCGGPDPDDNWRNGARVHWGCSVDYLHDVAEAAMHDAESAETTTAMRAHIGGSR